MGKGEVSSCEDVAIGMFMFDIKAFEDASLVIYTLAFVLASGF